MITTYIFANGEDIADVQGSTTVAKEDKHWLAER
jgi:hypothetical protein